MKVLAVNAFRRGTGATQFAANLAAQLALLGRRVGLIDADLPAPTLHHLLNVEPARMSVALNDYLLGLSSLEAAVVDVTDALNSGKAATGVDTGQLYFVPAATDHQRATETLLAEYDLHKFHDGIQQLGEQLALDVLVVDTSAGTSKETLLAMALCDLLFVVLTLDHEEVQGTSVTIDAAKALSVPQTYVVVNKVAAAHDRVALEMKIRQGYDREVAAILPYVDDITALAGSGLFVTKYPAYQVTTILRKLAQSI